MPHNIFTINKETYKKKKPNPISFFVYCITEPFYLLPSKIATTFPIIHCGNMLDHYKYIRVSTVITVKSRHILNVNNFKRKRFMIHKNSIMT